jgi:hypothetical protein
MSRVCDAMSHPFQVIRKPYNTIGLIIGFSNNSRAFNNSYVINVMLIKIYASTWVVL